MYLGCAVSPTLECAHAAPGFSVQDWTLTHYWDMRKERGKRQTENTVSTICLELNPGVNKEFFLISTIFLSAPENLRNKILFKLHELVS